MCAVVNRGDVVSFDLSIIPRIVADEFLNGDLNVAGILIMAAILIFVFAITKNIFHSLLIGMIITLAFSYLNIINNDVMILLIIVSVLGLAMTAKRSFGMEK